ncbi:MAG TPA: hypothetical protein VLU46_06555 [Thermoanaerobaculia bacterium]|nr:hypothetical protein [Thermoanaerobaculia bacterium]
MAEGYAVGGKKPSKDQSIAVPEAGADRPLAGDQMAEDVERAPRLAAFVAALRRVGKIAAVSKR